MIERYINEVLQQHSLAVENLTKEQFAEVLKQAIACGDFSRHVYLDGQQMVYRPYAEYQRLQAQHTELQIKIEQMAEHGDVVCRWLAEEYGASEDTNIPNEIMNAVEQFMGVVITVPL